MFQSIKERRAEKALQAKTTAKLGHLSKQLAAVNAVLSEKDAAIRTLIEDTKRITDATAEMDAHIAKTLSDLAETKRKLASSEERTNAKAIELCATAGHAPKFNQ